MAKAKSAGNTIILGYQYFRDLYLKKKILYPTTYFLFPTFTSKQKIHLPDRMHNEIMLSFFSAYFEEFYYYGAPKYFPLSGTLVKGRGKPAVHKSGTLGVGVNWIWYDRPSLQYFSNIKLMKRKGSGRKVEALDHKYKLNNDIDILERSTSILYRFKNLDKLFKP